MTVFGFLFQDGLDTGAIYVLLAVALVMVFTVTRVVFVPQGDLLAYTTLGLASLVRDAVPPTVWMLLVMAVLTFGLDVLAWIRLRSAGALLRAVAVDLACPIAAAMLAWASIMAGVPYLVKVAAALAITVAMGPLIYRIGFQPIAAASPLVLLIAAIAAHFVLVGFGLYMFGPEGVRVPGIRGRAFFIGSIPVGWQALLILGTCAVLLLVLWLFFDRTLRGKSLRATAIHRRGARLVGIAPDMAGQLTFAIAAAIGGVSGILIAASTTIAYDTGFLLALKGFVGAILGGLSGYLLAAIGAIGVGLLESFASFWASAFKEVIVFSLLIPVLLWRSHIQPVDPDA